MAEQILVVDDESNLRKVLGAQLRRHGYEVTTAPDGRAALAALATQPFSAVLTDLKMPEMDGVALLRAVAEKWPDLPVILLTAHGTVDTAVEALKIGAFDFITKPYDQIELIKAVGKAVATHALHRVESPAAAGETAPGRFGLIGTSAPMRAVFEIVDKVAATPSTVLITGESGTGKELIAKALHQHSARSEAPFIRVNCAAIPDTLIESELFGYDRGAFTGATTGKPGRFELADGGTLFLDEIGEVSTEMQVKLLRAIQESEFERVGGIRTQRVDVRIIAATNRDLAAEVKAGNFREDLFYRLNVVPVRLPPLRERPEDIPLLVEHILDKYTRRLRRTVEGVTEAALAALSAYEWPGNIRELENVLERTLLFCDDAWIDAADLPVEVRGQSALGSSPPVVPDGITDLKEAIKVTTRRLERELIERALEDTSRNVTHAARRLGISRKSLQTKMKELNLRED
ncbi:MAG: sigma-54-dependent Fis family transcriptional regulator [Myxococcales bacterium]|nr:sigma-54-dependent Fis family transcriptional regulator [Myxococcales bacterium]